MSIQKYNFKTKVNNESIPYTQINTYVIQNINNLEAGFVWVYLQSKPTSWDVIKSHIKHKFRLSDYKIKRIFSYLAHHNLIKNIPVRTEDKKRISHHDIQVLNGEAFKTTTESVQITKTVAQTNHVQAQECTNTNYNKINNMTSTGSIINPVDSQAGSPVRTIKERYNTNKRKNLCASSDARVITFEDFWKPYPIKKNKIRAKEIWDKKITNDDQAKLILADIEKRKRLDREWVTGFVMHPDKYLRNERWTDEITPISTSLPTKEAKAAVNHSEFHEAPKEWKEKYQKGCDDYQVKEKSHGSEISPHYTGGNGVRSVKECLLSDGALGKML